MLLENISQQMAAMEMIGKRPRALRADFGSLDALRREVAGSGLLVLPGERIFGLVIEASTEPDFEVVT